MKTNRNPIRIGNISGSIFDRISSMQMLLDETKVDAITGDWLSEINLATLALLKQRNPELGYEAAFVECLELAIHKVAKHKIKVVTNAGGLNPKSLAKKVQNKIHELGLDLKVAYIIGDNLIDNLEELQAKGELLANLDNNAPFSSLGCKPIAANAYLGGWGIVKALNEGADIVVCGRVTDAAPVIALSAWWHNWQENDFDQLAGALIAGHLIECSTYVTGGNFPGFKSLGDLTSVGFPIAEIAHDGVCVITKGDKSNGNVTKETVITQFVYELQGSSYVNPDVTALLEDIKIESIGHNRIEVSGIKGNPPPPTAKVGISTLGGYTAEMHWYFTGLDIEEKVALFKKQAMVYFKDKPYTQVVFDTYGSVATNPKNQHSATVHLRVLAQTKDKELLSTKNFLHVLLNNTMQTYPGATCNFDFRLAEPRPFIEYWPTLIDNNNLKQQVILHNSQIIDINPATITMPIHQNFYDAPKGVDMNRFGDTIEAPLGKIVYARSGDKFTNSNVGFFVKHADEYEWLRALLSIAKIRELLAEDDIGGVIERVEFKNIHAVHFLLRGLLGKGAASTASYDCLGKNVAEYLRCKIVPIPKIFLERGII